MEDKEKDGAKPLEAGGRKQAAGEPEEKKGKKKTILIVLLALLLATSLAGLGYLAWEHFQPKTDAGATIAQYDGKSMKEIQEELNRQAEESRMTISVSPDVKLKDGKARVNVVNVEDNRFDQRFTLAQDGSTVYESGTFSPGQRVEWCDAGSLHSGEATITVPAIDRDTGKPYGNPQSVAVQVQ